MFLQCVHPVLPVVSKSLPAWFARKVSVRLVDRWLANVDDGATDSAERRYGKEIEVPNTK